MSLVMCIKGEKTHNCWKPIMDTNTTLSSVGNKSSICKSTKEIIWTILHMDAHMLTCFVYAIIVMQTFMHLCMYSVLYVRDGTHTYIVTSHNYHRIKSLAAGDSEECSLDVTFRVTERWTSAKLPFRPFILIPLSSVFILHHFDLGNRM